MLKQIVNIDGVLAIIVNMQGACFYVATHD